MSINVGINENVVITKAIKNDKGTLVIGFKQTGEVNVLEAIANSTSLENKEREILVYGPKVDAYGGGTKTPQQVLESITELKDPLHLILMQYMTTDKIAFDPFKGTGITTGNIFEKIVDQSVIDKIYDNVATQFCAMIQPFTGEEGKKMRVLFVRSSKAKHYPKIRTRYVMSNPFIEPMTVPVEASKVKFTKYEIDQKLNSGEPVSGAVTVSASEANQAASLFAVEE